MPWAPGKESPSHSGIHCLYSPGEGLWIEELLRFWSLVTFMSLLRLIPQMFWFKGNWYTTHSQLVVITPTLKDLKSKMSVVRMWVGKAIFTALEDWLNENIRLNVTTDSILSYRRVYSSYHSGFEREPSQPSQPVHSEWFSYYRYDILSCRVIACLKFLCDIFFLCTDHWNMHV